MIPHKMFCVNDKPPWITCDIKRKSNINAIKLVEQF